MKTKINNLLGAVLFITFGLTQNAAAQSTARIAFQAPVTVKTKKSTSTTYQIFSMNGDGSGVAQLTRWGGAWPSWSPDRKYLAFQRSTAVGSMIYVMEAKGEDKGGRTFAVGPAEGTGHDWSPDGTRILFTGTSAMGYGLWTVQINATTGAIGTPNLLRVGPGWEPKFSPDGKKIAFWLGGIVRVLDLTTQTEITFPWSSGAPSWSPDGSKIAFGGVVCYGSTMNCHLEIVIAGPDGTGWTPVTTLQSYSSFPTWSPDGKELAFYSQVSGSKALYKTTIGTGAVSLLFNGGQEGLDWTP